MAKFTVIDGIAAEPICYLGHQVEFSAPGIPQTSEPSPRKVSPAVRAAAAERKARRARR